MTRYHHDTTAVALAASGAAPRPALLELQPSPRCQLCCTYCHAMAPPRPSTVYGTSTEPLLRLDDYATLLESFRSLGGREVVVSGGGEPLLHPDANGLLDLVTAMFDRTHLYTNGLHPMLRSERPSWLTRATSIRISVHAGLTSPQRSQLASTLDVLGRHRRASTSSVTTVAILIDTMPPEELRALAAPASFHQLDGFELRSTVAGPSIGDDQVAAWTQLIGELGGSVRDVRVGPVPVPDACYASYRTIVVDPFGGYRVCCMRAHLPDGDLAHLGNIRRTSLDAALGVARTALSQLGTRACGQCSARDSSFSREVHLQRARAGR